MIGVLNSASCLITADIHADIGVEQISEGKVADRGVCSGGRTGFVTAVGDILIEVGRNVQDGCRQRVNRQPDPEVKRREVSTGLSST